MTHDTALLLGAYTGGGGDLAGGAQRGLGNTKIRLGDRVLNK